MVPVDNIQDEITQLRSIAATRVISPGVALREWRLLRILHDKQKEEADKASELYTFCRAHKYTDWEIKQAYALALHAANASKLTQAKIAIAYSAANPKKVKDSYLIK